MRLTKQGLNLAENALSLTHQHSKITYAKMINTSRWATIELNRDDSPQEQSFDKPMKGANFVGNVTTGLQSGTFIPIGSRGPSPDLLSPQMAQYNVRAKK